MTNDPGKKLGISVCGLLVVTFFKSLVFVYILYMCNIWFDFILKSPLYGINEVLTKFVTTCVLRKMLVEGKMLVETLVSSLMH